MPDVNLTDDALRFALQEIEYAKTMITVFESVCSYLTKNHSSLGIGANSNSFDYMQYHKSVSFLRRLLYEILARRYESMMLLLLSFKEIKGIREEALVQVYLRYLSSGVDMARVLGLEDVPLDSLLGVANAGEELRKKIIAMFMSRMESREGNE